MIRRFYESLYADMDREIHGFKVVDWCALGFLVGVLLTMWVTS